MTTGMPSRDVPDRRGRRARRRDARARSATTRSSACSAPRAERSKGAHRLYGEADVARLHELIRLRDLLGLSLEELVELAEAEEARAALRDQWAGRPATRSGADRRGGDPARRAPARARAGPPAEARRVRRRAGRQAPPAPARGAQAQVVRSTCGVGPGGTVVTTQPSYSPRSDGAFISTRARPELPVRKIPHGTSSLPCFVR